MHRARTAQRTFRRRFGRAGAAWAVLCSALSITAARAQQTSEPSPPTDGPSADPSAGEVPPLSSEQPTATPTAPPTNGPPGYLVTGDQTPTDVSVELAEDRTPRKSLLELSAFEGPFVYLRKQSEELYEKTGLKLGLAYTMLFQQASGGPGDRSAGGGDLDLLASWTAIGRGTKDTGTVYFAAEYRNQIGSQPPSALGGEIGSLTGTTNGFSERPMVVKEVYWKQALFDGRFVWGLGRVDPENLFGGHKLQSQNLYFLNQAFSTNPTVPYPGSGFAIAAAYKPVDWFYVGGGIDNANGSTTSITIDEFFDEAEFLTFAEAGYTPTIEDLGKGRYRISLWHIDAREKAGTPSDQGISLIADQELGKRTTAFARYAWADEGLRSVRQLVEGGIVRNGLLGGADDQTGFAAAWLQPSEEDLRDQYVLEVYQRFQVTAQTQLTFDAQLILDPSDAPDDDAVGVFSVRLRFAF